MTLTVGLLLASWIAVENCNPKPSNAGTNTGADMDAGTDAAAATAAAAGEETDAGPDALSPHEREEAAKDELENARAALERGDLADATSALERASAFDPNNPDIGELQEQVRALQADGG